jgi:hypothetical protein
MAWFEWMRRKREPDGLREWRTAWAAAAAQPEADAVSRLEAALEALGLPEESVEIEREMLDGLRTLSEVNRQIAGGGLPLIETGHRLAAGDPCHFSAPVSMPDEPAQPSGRLLLTGRRAAFAGGGGRAVPWHAIAEVLQLDRDIVLVVRGQDQPLRYRCNSFGDALTGARIARQLARR